MYVKNRGRLAKISYLCRGKAFYALFKVEVPIGRVVYRGNNNANANGGVSYANASNDASNSNTNVGSRLDNNQRKQNRRTAMGTCPRCGAEGAEPHQKQFTFAHEGHGFVPCTGKVKNGVTGRVW